MDWILIPVQMSASAQIFAIPAKLSHCVEFCLFFM